MRCQVCHRRLSNGGVCHLHPTASIATELNPRSDGEPPAIPGLEIVDTLGAGGFARVYLAKSGEQLVAVKVATRADDQRFARETAALRRLQPTSIVPRLVGEGTTADGHHYIVMERVEGQLLADVISARPEGKLSADEAVELVAKVGAAIDEMHAAGVLHRDLKPENVFLRPDGGVALIDFGLATQLGDSSVVSLGPSLLTPTGQRLGTVHYMAPEQCTSSQLDARTDLYALGVMLFEMLSGRPPFVGDGTTIEQGHVSRRPPRLSELAGLPPTVDTVIERALAKDREQRYPSSTELVAALREALRPARASTPRLGATTSLPAPVAASGMSTATATPPIAPAASKTRKVALLAMRANGAIADLTAAVALERGQVVRVFGTRAIAAFVEAASPEAGVRAALRAVQRLGGLADELVIHVADLRVRESSDGITMIGSALERVKTWGEPANAPSLLLTAAAAGLLESVTVQPATIEGYFVLRPLAPAVTGSTQAGPLVGRDDVTGALFASATACFADRLPTLETIVADLGLGRTRLLRAVESTLRDRRLAEVVFVTAGHPERTDPSELLRDLTRAAFAVPAEATLTVELVREGCERVLGSPESDTAWPALAFGLGLISETREEVAHVVAAPSALRQTLAHVLGTALRERATAQPFALLVDDAQWADQAILDALEVATRAGETAAIWCCVTVRTSPSQRASGDGIVLRKAWGERAGKHAVHILTPLDLADTRRLLADLLRPVEVVPEPVARRLHELTEGVPLYLAELAYTFRMRGVIRALGSTESFFVASEDLVQVSATPLVERLAARILETIGAGLRELAQLCAILGDIVEVADLDGVQRLLRAELGDSAELDPSVTLDRLVHHGLLRRKGPTSFAFRHPLQREAIEALVEPTLRRKFHDAARRYLATVKKSSATIARTARHAAACGMTEEAARAHLHLAKEASVRHRYSEAEQHYSSALSLLAPQAAPARLQALAGRGRMRYRVWRMADAKADLDSAIEIAEARNDEATLVDLLLEQATIHDWWHDFAKSSELVDKAREIGSQLFDPLLDARGLFAVGRSHYRFERLNEAIENLESAVQSAQELRDYETTVLSLILLAPALVFANRLDDAERRFEEVIEACERAGDRMHLATAYVNRMTLWMKRQQWDSAADDARLARELANDLGHAHLERMAVYNLAELLLWMGRLDEAAPHADRARSLQLRFFEHPVPEDSLLVARIHCARLELESAKRLLEFIETKCPIDRGAAPSQRALFRSIELVCADDGSEVSWEPVLADAAQFAMLDEQIEILYTRASQALRQHRSDVATAAIAEARRVAAGSPIWMKRLDDLVSTS